MSDTWLFHIWSFSGPPLGCTSLVTAFCDLCGPNILKTHTSYSLIFLIDADTHSCLGGQASPMQTHKLLCRDHVWQSQWVSLPTASHRSGRSLAACDLSFLCPVSLDSSRLKHPFPLSRVSCFSLDELLISNPDQRPLFRVPWRAAGSGDDCRA